MSDTIDIGRIKQDFLAAAGSFERRLTGLSDSFYRNPELGLEEKKTSAAMQGFLAVLGYRIEAGVAGMPTAFAARMGTGSPVIALLAEMDALPGIGHGCGHNIAGTASIGAAAALAVALRDTLGHGGKGTVLVLGTPAEELGKGKIEMINAGVFRDVDAAMMVHGSGTRTVSKRFLGLTRLNFTFFGHASHAAAYPYEGINALDAVIQTFNSISALRQQLRSDVRVHGIITNGGTAPNIIPEKTEAVFYVRAQDVRELESVKKKVIKCAEGAAVSTGCSFECKEVGQTNAPLRINRAFAAIYSRALEQLGLKEDPQPEFQNLGSSDIGNVSQAVPAIHPYVPVKKGVHIHTREFADATVTPEGHNALMEGVRAIGLTAIDLLFDPQTLKSVKEDFNNYVT